MQERIFNLAIAGFPYGGNGGISNEYPGVRNFLVEVAQKAQADPRIGEVHQRDFSDTPITMTRNASVVWARQVGADFLLMVDSDMQPDCELRGDPEAKPFWDTSLDFVVANYDEGPNVVCAPYCGSPPNENVYCFYWETMEHDSPDLRWKINQYSRDRAGTMAGIQPMAAQPTGLILFDMRAFELTDPRKFYKKLIADGLTRREAKERVHPWFYYEYEDLYQTKKCSTEDVTATRDISFYGHLVHGRDVIYCNWDAWAGHVKQKVVRKPRPINAATVHAQYRHAVETKQYTDEKMVYVGAGKAKSNGKVSKPQAEEVLDDGIVRIGCQMSPQCDLDALGGLIKDFTPKRVVEVGCWVGESSLAIAKNLPEDGWLYCVDTFLGSPNDKTGEFATRYGSEAVYKAFLNNTEPYRHKMVTLKGTSRYVSSLKWADPIDFLYLDAGHEYHELMANIDEWAPHLSDDAIVAGHDFEVGFPGVERAVRERFRDFTHIEGTAVWWAYKRDLNEPERTHLSESAERSG